MVKLLGFRGEGRGGLILHLGGREVGRYLRGVESEGRMDLRLGRGNMCGLWETSAWNDGES